MFFTAELESEARHPGTTRLNNWTFKKDDDRDMFMREVIEQEHRHHCILTLPPKTVTKKVILSPMDQCNM